MEQTIKKSLILGNIDKLNKDVITLIKSYIFHDLDNAYRIHQKKFNHTLLMLHLCLSRNNGFINSDNVTSENLISDDTSEHWCLGLEFDTYIYHCCGFNFPQLQGINCSICGGYKFSYKKICKSIKCKCKRHKK